MEGVADMRQEDWGLLQCSQPRWLQLPRDASVVRSVFKLQGRPSTVLKPCHVILKSGSLSLIEGHCVRH